MFSSRPASTIQSSLKLFLNWFVLLFHSCYDVCELLEIAEGSLRWELLASNSMNPNTNFSDRKQEKLRSHRLLQKAAYRIVHDPWQLGAWVCGKFLHFKLMVHGSSFISL